MKRINLQTDRLELIPLSNNQLILYLNSPGTLREQIGFVSRVILTEVLRKAINLKLEKMTGIDPVDHPWITYWLIKLRENQDGIGMLGFKGLPDQRGLVEISYGIDPVYQNQGYTTEAVVRLIQWAFEDPRCKRIIAPGTRKDNPGSNRVLEKVGMKIYSETENSNSWALDRPTRIKNS